MRRNAGSWCGYSATALRHRGEVLGVLANFLEEGFSIDEDLIRRRIESAQIMNEQTEERFEGEAMLRNAELMMMLILLESQVD